MLVTKFIVPITRYIHAGSLKFSLRDQQPGKRTVCKDLPNVKKEKTLLPKHEMCQEEYDKCPKIPNEYICGKKFISDSGSKGEMKTAVDNYQEAYQNVTKHANNILNGIQGQCKSLLEQLKKDIEVSKNNEEAALQEAFHDINKRLQKLLLLDPSFGSLKRKSMMSLSHQIRQAFDNVDCDTIPQIKRMGEISNNLERDIGAGIKRAKSLIGACHKCRNPQTLNKCVEENVNYAEKILSKTSQYARVSLSKIENLQREISQHHRATVGEISRTYHRKTKAFAQHLDDCIAAARKKKG